MTRRCCGPLNAAELLRLRTVVGRTTHAKADTASASLEGTLEKWLEEELLRHCASAYCNNLPPLPRSTIALAFSPDGKLLASTHGDHTVKITCCKTGSCLKVLRDHERTPWAVKFHPTDSNLLASGSLDSTVKIWDLAKGECLYSHDFGRPISSIAFVPGSEALAIASGHRLYMWKYNMRGSKADGSPDNTLVLLLKTRRSLRAVHFHPHGAPLLLTAEVNSNIGSSRRVKGSYPLDYTGVVQGVEIDERQRRCSARERLVEGCDRHTAHDPRVFGEQLSVALHALQTSANLDNASHPSAAAQDWLKAQDPHAHLQLQQGLVTPQSGQEAIPMQGHGGGTSVPNRTTPAESFQPAQSMLRPDAKPFHPQSISAFFSRAGLERHAPAAAPESREHNREDGDTNHLPGPQDVLQRISNSGVPSGQYGEGKPFNSKCRRFPAQPAQEFHLSCPRPEQRDHQSKEQAAGSGFPGTNPVHDVDMVERHQNLTQSNATSAASRLDRIFATNSTLQRNAEEYRWPGERRVRLSSLRPSRSDSASQIPCESRSGLWPEFLDRVREMDLPVGGQGRFAQGTAGVPDAPPHTISTPSVHDTAVGEMGQGATKEAGCHVLVRLWRYSQAEKPSLERLELAIQNAVLCSDMGLSISPCGKLLAVCAAREDWHKFREKASQAELDKGPYQLQVYSLEGPTFGQILVARPIKAAHCLTAIQFSPSARHIMVAYGRRDPSLQQQLQGENATSIVTLSTVLEVYRTRDMGLVRVLPSADDEINTALFHPFMGAGLAYGTKEGRLRILTHSSRPLLASKKFEGQARFEDELLAAAQEACSHTSEED